MGFGQDLGFSMPGAGGDAGQITPQSMTQPDKADAALKMLIGAMIGIPMGGGESAGAGAAAGTGAGAGGFFDAASAAMPEATASAMPATSPDIMASLFPQPANPMSSMLGVQNPAMTGIMDTIQRLQASPFHQGGIPGEGQLEMPQLGGVTLPKRRTSGRMF